MATEIIGSQRPLHADDGSEQPAWTRATTRFVPPSGFPQHLFDDHFGRHVDVITSGQPRYERFQVPAKAFVAQLGPEVGGGQRRRESFGAVGTRELVATKIRAIYQRKKGRDVFDTWLALTQLGLTGDDLLAVFTDEEGLIRRGLEPSGATAPPGPPDRRGRAARLSGCRTMTNVTAET